MPGLEHLLLLEESSLLVEMLCNHFLCIIDLNSSKCLLCQPFDYEVSDRKEKLLISAHLLVVFAPFCHYRFEPEALRKRMHTDHGLIGCPGNVSLVMGLSDLREVEQR